MKVQIISLFPDMFPPVFDTSMLWKAKNVGKFDYHLISLRDFGLGPRKQVDDTPYGGGDGMVLRPEPLFAAVAEAKKQDPEAKVYLPTPRGKRLNQAFVEDIAEHEKGIIIICPHYEGYDERITTVVDEQFSIGDYILTGGEIPAMLLVDSIVRLLPGVLGGETSAANESFADGETIEYPQYTRPEDFQGMTVPDVLLSGHHAEIAAWRQANSKKLER